MTTPEPTPWQIYLASLPEELRRLHDLPRMEDAIPGGGGRWIRREELLEVLGEQVITLPSGARPIRADRLGPGLLAGAWHHMVYGQVRAVLRLLEGGFEVEALANARVALEHAIAVQELALAADDDGLDALLTDMAAEVHRRQQHQLDHLEKVDAAAGGSNQLLLDATRQDHESRREPKRGRRTVKSMFERVSPGGHLHSAYARLSESAHAGLGSAVHYMGSALRSGAATVPAVADPVEWTETAALLCWSCWAADDAMMRFLVDGLDLAARHADLMARVGLEPG